jgi:hypothetical protein
VVDVPGGQVTIMRPDEVEVRDMPAEAPRDAEDAA